MLIIKFFIITLLSLSVIGCSSTPPSSPQDKIAFEKHLRKFSSKNVALSKNTIFVGKGFPSGRIVSLSYSKAKQVQRILSKATSAPKDDSSRYVSNLCYLEVAGKTWYFRPPFKPNGFRLPRAEQVQMEKLLSGYGVR